VFDAFDIDLVDLEGAGCCPAPGVFRSFDVDTWMVLGARNICISEEKGIDLVTGCNGCYGTLLEINHILKNDAKKRAMVNMHLAKIGKEFKGSINVRHVIDVLYNDVGIDAITDRVRYKIPVKVAAHSGCHLTKPAEIRPWHGKIDDFTAFDELIEATGAESIPYKDKFMCCGAGGGVRTAANPVSADFTREKLTNMKAAGADAVVLCCPFCMLQFDVGQNEVNKNFPDLLPNGEPFKIPVIYYTQLLGMAMGMNPYDLGLLVNKGDLQGVPPFTSIDSFLEKTKRILAKEGAEI
jgi:heterodisulfide reductase subunit B